jgi:YfiH family protein
VATLDHARYHFSDSCDGDLAAGAVGVDQRRQRLVALPWTWLRQVPGRDVVVVEHPGARCGATADGAVTSVPGAALSVQVADCAPVAVLGASAVGVAHAGWRGLVAGIVPAVVDAVRRLSPGPLRAVIGPCIRPPCYAFGDVELDRVSAVVGDEVRARTSAGDPALDLAAGVRSALAGAGVAHCDDVAVCTVCSPRHWSYRRDGAAERQALTVWLAS